MEEAKIGVKPKVLMRANSGVKPSLEVRTTNTLIVNKE